EVAAGQRRVQHAPPVELLDDRERERAVLRRSARHRVPDELAGPLVERVEAAARRRLAAPAAGHAVRDRELAVDEHGTGPAVRERQAAELLAERVLPAELPVA